MESFIDKVRYTFQDCLCDYYTDDAIIFRRYSCHYQRINFDLKVFIEKLDKLIQETSEIQKRPYVEIHYRMIGNYKHFNMFGIEIPHIVDVCMDFKPKLYDLDSICEEFFANVHRERFVDFEAIEVRFPGVKVMCSL